MDYNQYFKTKLNKQGLSTAKVEWIFLSIIGLLFYWLNYYSVLGMDDWYYALICEDSKFFHQIPDRNPIKTIGDIFVSQYNHYQYVNGRFWVHFIIQLFAGILGLKLFQFINSIMFVLLVRNLCRLCIPLECRNSITHYIITFLIFWFSMGLIISVGFTYLSSIAFSVNYLWSSTLFVSVIYYFYKYNNHTEKIALHKKCAIFALALLCGASHEAFSIGLSVMIFIYYLFNHNKCNGITKYLLVGLCIGAATLIFAPANFIRVSGTTESGLIFALKLRLDQLGLKWIQLIPVVLLLFLFILSKLQKGKLSRLFRDYNFLHYTAFFTFAFLFFVGMAGNPQMFSSITIMVIILIVKLLFSFDFIVRYNKLLMILSTMVLCIHYIFVLQYRQQENANYNDMFNEYVEHNTGLITFRPIDAHKLISSYGMGMTNLKSLDFSFSGINQLYFNWKRPFVIIPDLSEGISSYHKIDNDKYDIYDNHYFYIIKSADAENEYDFYTAEYDFNSIMLQLWFRYCASKPDRINLEFNRIEYNNEAYYIIRKNQQDKTIHNICM